MIIPKIGGRKKNADPSIYFSNGKYYVSLNSEAFETAEEAKRYIDDLKQKLLDFHENERFVSITDET